MTTWSQIFPDVDGSPVRGEPGDFRKVEHEFDVMGGDAQDALDKFNKIKSDDGVSELRGQAADAFERFVREVADSLGDLPRVCHEASLVFKKHADDLAALRNEVASALARATTKWNERNDLQTKASDADRRVTALQTQLDLLPCPGTDPNADAQRPGLESELDEMVSNLQWLLQQLMEATDELNVMRRQYDGFHADERSLRAKTHHRLDGIDLGDLKDPGRFSSFCNGAFHFVMHATGLDAVMAVVDAIVDLGQAIASGDWAKVLWKLREMLDVAILVLAVIALCTPLGPIMLAVAVGLAVAKLAVDVALYETKWPNPETGEVISAGDLVIDAVGVIFAGSAAIERSTTTLVQTGLDMLRLRGASTATKMSILRRNGMSTVIELGPGASATRIVEVKGLLKFKLKTGNDVAEAIKNLIEAPTVLTDPVRSPLSTDVFQSIADGHSQPEGVTELLVTHLIPNTVRHTTCVPA